MSSFAGPHVRPRALRNAPPARSASRHQGGFTFAEILVSLAVLVVVLVAVLLLFDFSAKVARVQTNVAEMQQSIRIAQYDMVRDIRMAGRGGLPRGPIPASLALAVRDNVPPSGSASTIAFGIGTSPKVLPGTDVLTVRGVLESPVYQLNPATDFTFNVAGDPTQGGSIHLQDPNPTTGVAQDLGPLIQAVNANRPEALIVVSPLSDQVYAVVRLDFGGGGTNVSDPKNITIDWALDANYIKLSPGGGFPAALSKVAYVGILEEYRFYVRDEHAVPGDPTSERTPRLSRARFYPETETAHPGGTLADDIADNVIDLQVALGIDTGATVGQIDEGTSGGGLTKKADDWLYNSPDDDPTDGAKWNGVSSVPPLYFVRLTTIARTDRRDPTYQAPLLGAVEDKDFGAAPYNASPYPQFNAREQRMFRRRVLETVVDLRNVS